MAAFREKSVALRFSMSAGAHPAAKRRQQQRRLASEITEGPTKVTSTECSGRWPANCSPHGILSWDDLLRSTFYLRPKWKRAFSISSLGHRRPGWCSPPKKRSGVGATGQTEPERKQVGPGS